MTTKTDGGPAYPLPVNDEQCRARFESGEAMKRFSECGGEQEQDPIERLRFYCSIAMSGQDWIDVEPFFDAVTADRQQRGEDAT